MPSNVMPSNVNHAFSVLSRPLLLQSISTTIPVHINYGILPQKSLTYKKMEPFRLIKTGLKQ